MTGVAADEATAEKAAEEADGALADQDWSAKVRWPRSDLAVSFVPCVDGSCYRGSQKVRFGS